MAEATARAGLDLAELESVIGQEGERLEAAIMASHGRMEEVGHWGVPMMVFQNEPFFGQDRIDTLIWRMEQHGLQRRTPAEPA